MLLFGEELIRRVDWAQSASLKNVAPNSVFQIDDCIGEVEKTNLFKSYQ